MTGPRPRSGGAANGDRVGRTRIRAIGSKRRIDPSGRGRKRTQRRSAIATSPVMSRRSPAKSGVPNHQVRRAGIGRGTTSPAAIDHGANKRRAREDVRGRGSRPIDPVRRASADQDRTNRCPAGRPTIDRGRPGRLGRAHRGSPGWTSHLAIARGATSRRIVRRPAANPSRGAPRRRPAHRGLTGRGATNQPAVHLVVIVPRTRVVVPLFIDRVEADGAESRAIRIASRSRRAHRGPTQTAIRCASGATTRIEKTW